MLKDYINGRSPSALRESRSELIKLLQGLNRKTKEQIQEEIGGWTGVQGKVDIRPSKREGYNAIFLDFQYEGVLYNVRFRKTGRRKTYTYSGKL